MSCIYRGCLNPLKKDNPFYCEKHEQLWFKHFDLAKWNEKLRNEES